MKANKEQSNGIMGLVMSVLLHAIFFAGCFALDATSAVTSSMTDTQAIQANPVADQTPHKPNS